MLDATTFPQVLEPFGPVPGRLPNADVRAAGARAADAALIELLVENRAEGLSELFDAYGRMAYSLAYRVTRDPGLAEDAVQEAFLGAWRNARQYAADRGSVKTWLMTIVHRRSVDIVRRRRHPTESLTDATSTPELASQDTWAEVRRGLDRAVIIQALAQLPAVQRAVIELAYFDGLTQIEIAAATGAPLGTVKSRARAGLESLRGTLIPCRNGGGGRSARCAGGGCDCESLGA